MAGRFFPNIMPDFVAEDQEEAVAGGDALSNLLSKPYSSLAPLFKRTALDLKETCSIGWTVEAHQLFVQLPLITLETWGLTAQKINDFSLYSGTLGTAFLLLKSYLTAKNSSDLALCLSIVNACNSVSLTSRDTTFICGGRAGVCALGAVAAKLAGDLQLLYYYLNQFGQIKLSEGLPDELLYGKVGFLWACLFLNQHVGDGTISAATTRPVVAEIMKSGRAMGKKGECPLMFEWYGEKYWGAAHGLAGIMHVLMDMDLKPDEAEDVKATLIYVIRNRFPSGNYPATEEDRNRDVLVHWCHGAPGIALTLVKAAKVFGDDLFLQAALDAAEVVWKRGLLKRVGICHGISGNAYVFLSLYRLTGKVEHLYRAKAFGCFLLDRSHKLIARGEMHGGDSPYSLFEGIGGMAYLFLDMVEPLEARFPGYEL